MRRWRRLGISVLSAVLMMSLGVAAPATAAVGPAARPAVVDDEFTFVIGTVLAPPRPVLAADGQQHLAYELQLYNIAPFPVRLRRLDALDAATGAVLGSWRGQALAAVVARPLGGGFTATLGPGETGFAILDVQRPRTARLPRALRHRLTVAYEPDPRLPEPTPYFTGPTRVGQDRARVIAPPLRGPRWVAANGCCGPSAHRLAILPINGRLENAERFAIDFVQLDTQGRLFSGPMDRLASYPGYGRQVLSVAAGRVVRVHDGEPEQVPPTTPPSPTPETAGGNWVVVDIGGGQFAFYAHLQRHSLTVEVGDVVRTGQVLGLVGNTGNSTAPHLHFHLMDGPSPLASEGLPFEVVDFTSAGVVTNPIAVLRGRPAVVGLRLAGRHRSQLPLDLQVVNFGQGPAAGRPGRG
jgi:Peptidase family M23